jgi:hypothetical protein
MNTRTVRMFAAMLVAIGLMFVGDVIWSFSRSPVDGPQPTYPISSDQAGIIAQDTAPRATIIGTPVLTSHRGTVAYAVPLDTGTIYVEATTGRVLVNTVATAVSDE